MTFYQLVCRLGACVGGAEWAKNSGGFRKSWERCNRGDWLLWLVYELSSVHCIPSYKGVSGKERVNQWFAKISKELGITEDPEYLDTWVSVDWAGMSQSSRKPGPRQARKLALAARVTRKHIPMLVIEKALDNFAIDSAEWYWQ